MSNPLSDQYKAAQKKKLEEVQKLAHESAHAEILWDRIKDLSQDEMKIIYNMIHERLYGED